MTARVIILAADAPLRESLAERVRSAGALVAARWSLSGWTMHDMRRLRPQLVFVARGTTGECATLRTLAMAASLVPTLVLDDCRRAEWLAQLLLCGAWGVAPAEADEASLAESIDAVRAGELAWHEGAAGRAAHAILQAHGQGNLARLRPSAAREPVASRECSAAAQRLLLAQLSSLSDRQALVELSLALGLSLTDVESRLDWAEHEAPEPTPGPHPTPAAPVARPALQNGLRYLVSSLRALRHES